MDLEDYNLDDIHIYGVEIESDIINNDFDEVDITDEEEYSEDESDILFE